ncbi:MAG: CBS domain-containing protein, partial [bacterium]
IYDHHPRTDQDYSGDLEVVEDVGATTTILVEILRRRRFKISPEEATVFALGIYEDTGSLTFASTTPRDLNAVAFLKEKGAHLEVIPAFIGRDLDAEQISLLNDLLQSIEILDIHGLPISLATSSTDAYIGDLALLVHKMVDMENLKVLITLVRMEDRVILVARSRLPEVNVAKICEEFGGGGHSTAASASIRELTLVQVRENLLKILDEMVGYRKNAMSIMSSPAIEIGTNESISTAAEVMSRYNINSLLVVEKGKKLKGIITRGVVERAILHGLSDSPLSEYMLTEYQTAEGDSSMDLVREYIIEKRQRMLPVMDGRKIIGVITRTDLLEVMHEDLITARPHAEGRGTDDDRRPRRRNLKELMGEALEKGTLQILHTVGKVADSVGLRVYLVGGLARDVILRNKNLDIDLVVEGDGIDFGKGLAKKLNARIRPHRKFKTAVIVLPDGLKLDVASARTEYYEAPGAHPMVERGSIKLDLYRRDFSINALAINLNDDSFGQVVDYFGGLRDIKDRTIRILHNLSFVDDPTRMIRAVRFEQRFGFTIGKHTEYLLKGAVAKGYLTRTQGQRVLGEIRAILKDNHPERSFARMEELGILKAIHPSFVFDRKFQETFRQVEKIYSWFQYLFLDGEPDVADIYLNTMMLVRKPKEREEILHAFHLSDHLEQKLFKRFISISEAMRSLTRIRSAKLSRIAQILDGLSVEDLLIIMSLSSREETAKAISLYLSRLRFIESEINGQVLKEMGYKTGPLFRKIMESVKNARLDGEVKSLAEEKNWVKEHFPIE